jgi:hypothetical protein
MSNTFWLENPSVLLNKNHITEIWPVKNTTLESKLNSITRIVILLGVLGYFLTKSNKIPISAVITLVIIVIIYKTQKTKQNTNKIMSNAIKEGFTDGNLYKMTKNEFYSPTKSNPLMNVLPTEIIDTPKRKPAAPSFNPVVEEKINKMAGNVGIHPEKFVDLEDKINFENSMRQFVSNPSTTIPNNQTAFAEFCYGNMPSCKDGDGLQCLKDNPRWINY